MFGMLFAKVLHMSLIGCYSILVVLLVRQVLIRLRMERKYAYFLWLAVFLNLCLPFSFSGSFTLIPQRVMYLSPEAILAEGPGLSETEEPGPDLQAVHVLPTEETEGQEGSGELPSVQAAQDSLDTAGELRIFDRVKAAFQNAGILNLAGVIWILGVLAFLVCNLGAAFRFSRRLSEKKTVVWEEEERIAQIEGLPAPFLWGLLRPVICLPAKMEPEEKRYITAHESFHRKRKDHLIKPLIFAVAVLHWFNPFVWLAYSLCCKDMEISCDEAVLAGFGSNIRKAYAKSLLKYAAKQNGYVISPLTFGEPSVKSRIRNVLRYKKRSVWISLLALVCVAAVAAGLLTRPAGQPKEAQADTEIPKEEDQTAEGPTETQPENISSEVLNNGGELIQVKGELYYIAGQELYSNGQKIFTSRMDEEGSWAVYSYELDGSGYEKLLDGRIVGWAKEWNCPYVLTTSTDTKMGTPGAPGLYLLGELDVSAVAYTTDQFLDVDGEYAYFARETEDGIYIDRYWAGDGTITENFIGAALEAWVIPCFHAEGDYLLFAAADGRYQGSGGYYQGDFYSYNQTPGRLLREHLTDAVNFTAADGFIYYEKYSNESGESAGLYRVSYDLTGEELIGEGLHFLAYDESDGMVIAWRQTTDVDSENSGYACSLVRINQDGSGEQVLLDMTQILENTGDSEENTSVGDILDWQLEEDDRILFSEANLVGDVISVKVEQEGYREDHFAGWRGSVRTAYFLVNGDGSGYRMWDPEQLGQERDHETAISQPVVGTPCDPEEAGWDLASVTDGGYLAALSYAPEPADQVYLLGQTDAYTLYGSGDYESMLLEREGQYAEISYPYLSNYMILPDLMEFDYDGDGTEELAIKLNVKHGTGVYVDSFFMADLSEEGELFVYQFTESDITAQLIVHLSVWQTDEGLQAYVDGVPVGPAMAGEESKDYDHVSVGNQIRFYYGDCRVFVGAKLEYWSSEEQMVIPEYNDYQIQAELSYADGGQFTLTTYEGRNWLLEEAVRTVLAEDYMRRDTDEKDTYIRINQIRYRLEDLENDTVEVEAVILPVGSESYDYALMELTWTDNGWNVANILYEK